jgi:hypothetical protein
MKTKKLRKTTTSSADTTVQRQEKARVLEG